MLTSLQPWSASSLPSWPPAAAAGSTSAFGTRYRCPSLLLRHTVPAFLASMLDVLHLPGPIKAEVVPCVRLCSRQHAAWVPCCAETSVPPGSRVQITCHPLLWRAAPAPRGAPTVFQAALDRPALAFLGDHRVAGHGVLPTIALLEMGAAAGKVSGACSAGWVHCASRAHSACPVKPAIFLFHVSLCWLV